MLSQDNYPSPASGTKPSPRFLIACLSTATLAFLGLMVTTTQLQWKLPAFDNFETAPASTSSLGAKSIQTTTPLVPRTTVPVQPAPTQRSRKPIEVVPVDTNFQSENSKPSSLAPAITQPGNNITIELLPDDHSMPVTSSGMPEFYKTVLEPEGKMTELGLMQRKVRMSFGYDQQDIFTAELSEGAYVLHCQRLKTTTIRAMCWRELRLSDDRWIQYRFPRSQLKDWRKIEQTVRANIS